MNLPNKISITRLIMIPFVVFFYLASFIPWGKFIALALFIIAALTDFLDGYIARKYNLVTNLGKFIDPIADKVLVMAGLLLVVCDGTVLAPYGAIMAIIILAREFIISGFRLVASNAGLVLAADKWGKWKTLVTDVAIPLYMFYAWVVADGIITNAVALSVISWVSFGFLAVATLLTIISGLNYIIKNRQVLK